MSRPGTDRLKVNPPLGMLPALQYLLPQQLEVDPTYQRSMEEGASQSLIRKIAMFWNWDLCQPLVVARRDDGRLFVIDGQHRLEAAKLRGDIAQLPAVVVQYASAADEAASFVHLNQQRRPLSKLDVFKAAVASGDAEACAISKAMAEAGLSVANTTNWMCWKPGQLSNVGGIERAWRGHGAWATSTALRVLAQAWAGGVLQYAGSMFPGIAAVCADEMAGTPGRTTLAADKMEQLIALLGRRSQTDWRRDMFRAKAEEPNLNFGQASALVLRRAWGAGGAGGGATAPVAPTPFRPQPSRVRRSCRASARSPISTSCPASRASAGATSATRTSTTRKRRAARAGSARCGRWAEVKRGSTTLRRFGSIAPGGGHGVVLSALDQAYRGGRTMFPSRVFDPGEVGRVLKDGHQSRKIGAMVTKGPRKGWPIFTLTLEEGATCPRSCLAWGACYGNNMQAAERIVAGFALEAALIAELAALQAAHPSGFLVRLHVLGDFYSANYVHLWRVALENCPALHVFGFTAHHPTSEIGRAVALLMHDTGWARWAIRFSGMPNALRASRVLGPGESDGPEDENGDGGAVLCPAQTGATDCCATCALCWQSERSIAFRRH